MFRQLVAAVVFATSVEADVPLPPQVTNPLSATEAWNVIRLATENVERLVRESRPLEIASQVSLLSPSLRVLGRSPVKAGFEARVADESAVAFKLVNVMAKESMTENAAAMPGLLGQLKKSIGSIAEAFESDITTAEVFHCPLHTDYLLTTRDGATQKCGRCQHKLQVRRIPYSFIYARAEQPALSMATSRQGAQLTIKLAHKDGRPVVTEDLWPVHTETVQVVVFGPEYGHFTATPSASAGDYTCDLAVSAPGTYRYFVGLTPAVTGLPEYHSETFVIDGSAEASSSESTDVLTAKVDGYAVNIAVAGKSGNRLRAGRTQALHVQFQDAQGQPLVRLEPLLQAYAHIDAFYEGTETLQQLHPMGGDILRDDLRGGPGLAFKIYSPEAGTLKAYLRFKVDGRVLVAPLCLQVLP
ncbi:MAG: hypothetical protein JNJ83_11425 [Verrucomicrobiaceae bacterium]|nr:hypothetical protein [Verrucomicrobiaceae bacterium]